MRALGYVVAAVAAAVAASSAPGGTPGPVPCSDRIDTVRFPFAPNRYRLVLGALSVPPRYVGEMEDTGQRPWRYWLKSGIVVRVGGPPVTITVPPAWRGRLAIGWGNRDGAFSRLTIAGCNGSRKLGFAYAGGFMLRVPSACAPLVFHVGKRTTLRRFGLGKACSKA